MTYDDERVVALLKETVPAVPDVPGRVDAVRRLAARQRTFVQVQVLGAAASVVLLVAAVAVLVRPGGTQELRVVADPARVARDAFFRRTSVYFESVARTPGDPSAPEVRIAGAYRIDGTLYYSGPAGDGPGQRYVDGVLYRGAEVGEELPPGKTWVRERGVPPKPADEGDARILRAMGEARFVRFTEVRGVRVAEYVTAPLSLPEQAGATVTVTFAIDRDGLPRRLALRAEVEGGTVVMDVATELFGYDESLTVEHPPASQVVDLADVKRVPEGPGARTELWACTSNVTRTAFVQCVEAYERRAGTRCTYAYESREEHSYRCEDGTESS